MKQPVQRILGFRLTKMRMVDPVTMRLKELERNLPHCTAEYKDNYPDIIATKLEIEKVKAQLAGNPDRSESCRFTELLQSIRI